MEQSFNAGLRPFNEADNLGTPIDWVVIGAESGFHAREMKTEWALDIINECKYSQVPVYMKQFCKNGKKIPYEDFPKEAQIRRFPEL